MEDLNSVTLVGRLASDPELRSLASGTSVCQMRLAFNTSKKLGDGSYEDVANFISVTVWGRHGETCARHLAKGKRVALKGRIQMREWNQNGQTRSVIEIVADRVQFIEPRDSNGGGGGGGSQQRQQQQSSYTPADDEIPF